jgi:hypothetical protein
MYAAPRFYARKFSRSLFASASPPKSKVRANCEYAIFSNLIRTRFTDSEG